MRPTASSDRLEHRHCLQTTAERHMSKPTVQVLYFETEASDLERERLRSFGSRFPNVGGLCSNEI
jgi:hypothetical protein